MIFSLTHSKNISLALGSGSAKGVSHIGIIEEFLNSGYKIEAVSGSSMGALVAAYYALGKLDILKEWVMSLDKKTTIFTMDFSIKGGFIAGNKLMKVIQAHLGNAKFSDCKVPLYIAATNFDLAREEIFESGLILDAVRASIAIPGVIKPYKINGYYYVDGAVSDPVPVSALIDRGYKNVIGIHLNEKIEPRENGSSPSIINNMLRSMSLVCKFLAEAKMKNIRLVISPALDDVGMFDLYKSKDIIEAGRKAVRDKIVNGRLIKQENTEQSIFRRLMGGN